MKFDYNWFWTGVLGLNIVVIWAIAEAAVSNIGCKWDKHWQPLLYPMPPCLHIVAWFSAELLRDDVTKAKLKSAISQWYKCNNKIIMSHANESKFKQQQDNKFQHLMLCHIYSPSNWWMNINQFVLEPITMA